MIIIMMMDKIIYITANLFMLISYIGGKDGNEKDVFMAFYIAYADCFARWRILVCLSGGC